MTFEYFNKHCQYVRMCEDFFTGVRRRSINNVRQDRVKECDIPFTCVSACVCVCIHVCRYLIGIRIFFVSAELSAEASLYTLIKE